MIDEPEADDMQQQIDALHGRVSANRADIDNLLKAGQVDRGDIDDLQIRGEVDRHLIAELQANGVLHAEQTRQLEDALRSARVIGAAIGIVMMASRCSQQEAFEAIKRVSNDTNRKLRDIAEDVLLTGDLGRFPAN